MNKLGDLLAEFCPDGVEYKTIGEIAVDIFRGSGIKREQITETGIPCARYGEIYTTYGVWFDSCVSHTDESAITSKKYFEHGDILFAITGESVEDIAKCTAYIGQERCLAGGDIVVLRHNQNPKYLSYALSTTEAQTQKSKGKVKSKVVHSSVPAIKELVVPIPPLEVQQEIVRILDQLTELTTELTTKLNEELTARKKQFEYYRDKLLNSAPYSTEMQFGEFIRFQNGFAFKSNLFKDQGKPILRITNIKENCIDESGLVYFDPMDYKENLESFVVEPGDVVVAMSGATTGKIGVNTTDRNFYLNQRVGKFVPNENIILKRYLYHLLLQNSNRLSEISQGSGAQPNLSSEKLKKLTAKIPPISEQEKVVSLLDRFDAFCNDLTSGLPAEIEARRKQYEYYRDKLLAFRDISEG